ncbi:VanZ family protein [Lacibacterium aquatile]|uniref:VanZ family protein n=1 Tax=Lacibacterium aquatile TaxID=1168082 RepID=A0ABW5DLT1_9PROT
MPQTAPPTEYGADKFLHLLGYGGLMVLAAFAWPRVRWRWCALALILGGVGIELAQGLTPTRYPSMGDVLANGAGVLIGWGLAELVVRRSR